MERKTKTLATACITAAVGVLVLYVVVGRGAWAASLISAWNEGAFLPWAGAPRAKVVLPLGDAAFRYLWLWLAAGASAAAAFGYLPVDKGEVAIGRFLRGWRGGAVFAAAAFVATALISSFVFGRRPVELDEYVYMLQARIFARGALTVKMLDAAATDWTVFFKGPTEVVMRGRWFTMYPPLHPLTLALGEKLAVSWLVGPAFSAATAATVFFIGRRLYGVTLAAAAAALIATSPFFLFNGAARYSETSFLCFYALFLYFGSRGAESAGPGDFFAAGLFAGLAFQCRELAAVQMAILPAAYIILKKHPVPRRRRLGALAAAAAVAAAPEFVYNAVVTGAPFRFPRFMTEVHHFSPDAVPFGLRLSRFGWQIQIFGNELWGWPLFSFIPAFAAPFLKRRRVGWDWIWGGTLLLLPASNLALGYHGVFYGPRYLYPLLIPAAFLTASFFAALAPNDERERCAARCRFPAGLLVGFMAFNWAFYLPRAVRTYTPAADEGVGWVKPAVAAVTEKYALKNAVVFLKPRYYFRWPMPNDVSWRGDVIYARDFGAANIRLMALLPGRRYYILDYERALAGAPALTAATPATFAGEGDGAAYWEEVAKMKRYVRE